MRFKNEKLFRGVHEATRCLFNAFLLLLCLYVLPLNSFSANEKPAKKINLKVGDVLNYQLDKKVYQADDSSNWVIRYSFEVTGKKDSLYSMIGRFKLQTVASKNHYRDSRFSEESNFMPYLSVEKYPAIPFNLSENGFVHPLLFLIQQYSELFGKITRII